MYSDIDHAHQLFEINDRSKRIYNRDWYFVKNNELYNLNHQCGYYINRNKQFPINSWTLSNKVTNQIYFNEVINDIIRADEFCSLIEKGTVSLHITNMLLEKMFPIIGHPTFNYISEVGWILYDLYKISIHRYEHDSAESCCIFITDKKMTKKLSNINQLLKFLNMSKVKKSLEQRSKSLDITHYIKKQINLYNKSIMFNTSTDISWHLSNELTFIVNKYEHKSMEDCSIYIKTPSSQITKITFQQLMEHINEYKTTQNKENLMNTENKKSLTSKMNNFDKTKCVLFIKQKKKDCKKK
jgi:hypothetical protein